MKIPFLVGFCAAAMLSATGTQAADVAAGEKYFKKKCAICHGKTAKGAASFSSLRDRTAEYLADRLETYRARGKVGSNSAIMFSHAGKLSDDDIADISTYLETAFGPPKSEPERPKTEEKREEKDQSKIAPRDTPSEKADIRTDVQKETSAIACAQERGETLGDCGYRLKQAEDGTITLTAAFTNGFKRKLFFKDGKFLKASATMSGTGKDIDADIVKGLHIIRVDDQRYEIPDTLFTTLE